MRSTAETAEFAFLAYAVDDLRDPERRFTLSSEDIALLNPNTRTCPIFQSRRDADLTKAIYRRLPVLVREAQDPRPEENTWRIRIRRIFDMGLSKVSALSKSIAQLQLLAPDNFDPTNPKPDMQKDYIPMFEGKMFDAFNHRAAGVLFNPRNIQRGAQAIESTHKDLSDPCYSPQALYWIPRTKLDGVDPTRFSGRWILGFKDITSVTNERSMIAAILPSAATNFTIRVVQFLGSVKLYTGAIFVGILNSFAFDYLFRKSLAGLHASDYITHQVPVVGPTVLGEKCIWAADAVTVRNWLVPNVLELTYTSWDLNLFAKDCAWSGPPFRWDEERRFMLRCELDAAFFHLYLSATNDGQWKPARVTEGAMRDETPEELVELKRHFSTPRDAVSYILDTFSIVRRRDEEEHGEYRTKGVILEIYDEMADAIRTGKPYQTRLDPPPGPPIDARGNLLPMYQLSIAKWPAHIHPPNPAWDESLLSAWFNICQKRWEYLEDDQIFPWGGREAFVYALIPYLIQEKPGEKFESYRDAALLASRPDRCETLLITEELRREYRRGVNGLDWLQFPDGHRIRPQLIRKTLQSKDIIQTDAKLGATTVLTKTILPPLPPEMTSIVPLILKSASNLDKLQRGVLEEAETSKLSVKSMELVNEMKRLMAA